MYGIREVLSSLANLLRWWVVVTPWERILRVRMGKKIAVLSAGIHFRIPLLDVMYRQSIRLRVVSLPQQTLTTSDNRTLTLQAILQYEILDLEKLYDKLHDAEGTLKGMASGAIAEYVNSHTFEECSPKIVETEANKNFSVKKYGISSTKISVVTFAYVKTYRLITGEGYFYSSSDSLDTNAEESF